MPKNFAIIGVGGYIAPRHLRAIKDTGNDLIYALDRSDSVGILDRFFEDVYFFKDFEIFEKYVEKHMRENGHQKIDYVSICTPNKYHDSQIRFALRIGANAICEKPIVLNPENLDALEELEKQAGKKIYTVLQLRLHPSIKNLKARIDNQPKDKRYNIDLTYITSRGRWYFASWKGNEEKSGGIATNIGIHFFDMLIWLFGNVTSYEVYHKDKKKMSGFLELEKADVRWFLSLDKDDLPEVARTDNKQTYRSITIDNEEIEFSDGFTELHTEIYNEILNGKGFGIKEARPSIKLAYELRHIDITKAEKEKMHPFLKEFLSKETNMVR